MFAGLFDSVSSFFRSRYLEWINKRIPPSSRIVLSQKNIFIFPNRQFLIFFSVIMALWLGATNYDNNVAFGLCFLLLAIFVVCILHTFNNMSGLEISLSHTVPVFEGDFSEVELSLKARGGQIKDSLWIGWRNSKLVNTGMITSEGIVIKVPVHCVKRGWFNPGRILIETTYPLGFIRSWAVLDLDVRVLCYPKPFRHGDPGSVPVDSDEGEELVPVAGHSDFDSLRDYEQGESMARVAWKQYARGGALKVKHFSDYADKHFWLDFDALTVMGLEEKLSTLCYWALDADESGTPFGLRLPGLEIPVGQGSRHLDAVLRALALFGVEEPASPQQRQRAVL
jgi:uncharacterized protein (DUF58 family)